MPSLACDYPDRWRAYRRCSWLTYGSFFGAIPAAIAIGVPLSELLRSEVPFALVGVGAMIGFASGSLMLSHFECPRCGNCFHMRGPWYHNPWSRRCVNCGLPKREPRQ